jgi:transposase
LRASQEELNRIKAAMESEKKARVFKRYQALNLFLSGKTCNEVSDIVGITKNTVSNINMLYKNEGIDGIPDKTMPGRPSRLNEEQMLSLKTIILQKLPVEVGFPAEFNWTAGLIAKYIRREYKYKYSIKGITKILKRIGFSYTRPTYVLAKADKKKQEEFLRDFETVKKNCWMEKSSESYS